MASPAFSWAHAPCDPSATLTPRTAQTTATALGCVRAQPVYNTGRMVSRVYSLLVLLLLPVLGAPDHCFRLINKAEVLGASEEAAHSGREIRGRDDCSSSGDDRPEVSSPVESSLGSCPCPFAVAERGGGLFGFTRTLDRPEEKYAAVARPFWHSLPESIPAVPRVRRLALSLQVVAPPIQSHAPPILTSML